MRNYQHLKVDLSNCDKEPIHLIGRIQPHGFLIILNLQTYAVEQVSENISNFLQVDAVNLIGQSLEEITTAKEYTALAEQLTKHDGAHPQLLQLQGKRFFGFIHESEGSLVLECEPFVSPATDEEMLHRSNRHNRLQEALNKTTSLTQQAELVVEYVQQLLDYDRVMLYCFDEEWNGEVIAEKILPQAHSYLHHHFPASDIPKQARALLEVKHVRQIADVGAQAVNIVPYINPGTGSPSNIFRSELRNPSEIHLEYLENMGVHATLSISIMVQGKLWGIIACQHGQPKFIEYWKRELCHNVAQLYANSTLAHQEQRDLQQLYDYRKREESLLKQISLSEDIGEGLTSQQHNLLGLTQASGAAVCLSGKLYTVGDTPIKEELQELVNWIACSSSEKLFHTRKLSSHFAPANAYKQQASGLLALEISRFSQEYILYFKPEITENRIWAGDPEKPVMGQGKRLHPRKSFAKWTEVIKGKSEPWTLNELDITQLLVKDVIAVKLRKQAEKLQGLNRQLHKTTSVLQSRNSRLEDFTHIVSHNLRSPLSNMQGLLNLTENDSMAWDNTKVIDIMQLMVNNMATTIDDLNVILKSELEGHLENQEVSLAEVVKKQLQNLRPVILTSDAAISTDLQVDALSVPKVFLESILHNLISNALKYRSPDRRPEVLVRSWQEEETVCISVADNGLGMNLQKMGQKLFNLYATFHKHKEAKGLGLYLAKIQTEALGGKITVESVPGEGTTFKVSLPILP